MTTQLADEVSALTPLRGRPAIDGSARPKPRAPRRAAAQAGVYEGWACPRPGCRQEVPADVPSVTRHLNAHLNGLDEQLEALGPHGVRSEFDELGHVIVYGPGNAADHPVLWLRWDELIIDPGIQRDLKPHHPLRRPGVELDYRKTEALTVAAVRVRKEDGTDELLGYRPVEGQHRVDLGLARDPEGMQLCKIVTVESREEESGLGRAISHGRDPFGVIEDWNALRREGQENVTACAGLLERMGYVVTAAPGKGVHDRSIAAAGALLRIAGVKVTSDPEPVVTKDPAEAVHDLQDVLTVTEGIAQEAGEGSKRYNGMLLNLMASIIAANRDLIDIGRLAMAMNAHSAREWLKMAGEKELGGKQYLRARICKEYNRNKQTKKIA
jgi:hypothetical protein